jgi:hypothetical protein
MRSTTRMGCILIGMLVATVVLPGMVKGSQMETGRSPQRFVCNLGYTVEECNEQLAVLRVVVAKYRTKALGEWTWVMVKSKDWKDMMPKFRLDPDSPAFTCLETKTTFIEEVLVAKVPGRSIELISRWRMGMTELLETAVKHEMGHAICHSLDEHKAIHIAAALERNDLISCKLGHNGR